MASAVASATEGGGGRLPCGGVPCGEAPALAVPEPACSAWLWRCLANLAGSEKVWLQIVHAYGISPVCARRCALRRSLREKERGHRSHWNGFSPVCTREWARSLRVGVGDSNGSGGRRENGGGYMLE